MWLKNSNNNIIILFEISSLLLLIFLTFKINTFSEMTYEAQENRFKMMQKADQLRQSSDDLTHFARSYTVTTLELYKKRYFDTLKIRRGELERPLNYDAIYWDLDEETRVSTHPKGEKKSLKELMKNLPYTQEELELLKRSENNSDTLVQLELEAFKMMEDITEHPSNQVHAINLLHSKAYYQAKAEIMTPIDTFITMLNKRTTATIFKANKRAHYFYSLIMGLIALFILGNFILYLYLKKQTDLLSTVDHELVEKSLQLEASIDELSKQKFALDEHAIVAITNEKGIMTYVNDKFVQISGYSREELVGSDHVLINSKVHPSSFWKNMYKVVSQNKTWHAEVCNRAKDGSLYWLDTTVVPFIDSTGKPKHYVSIRTDITAQKLYEAELKQKDKELQRHNRDLHQTVQDEIEKNARQQQKMVEQSRLAQMGEMISMIAHQWRQPLTGIGMIANNLNLDIMMQTATNESISSDLELINTQVLFLSETIDNFRNFYKPNKEIKHVTLDEPILQSLDIIRTSLVAEGIELYEEYESSTPIALLLSEFMQVMLNLLKNSQDNFKEKNIKKGKISIITKDTTEGASIEISDNGGGIPEEILPKIFDPYFSTKDAKNGTGLGLYMSKTIVEEHHNGLLKAINYKDGICFKIELKSTQASTL